MIPTDVFAARWAPPAWVRQAVEAELLDWWWARDWRRRLEAHDEAIRRSFPSFRPVLLTRWAAWWEGRLTPFMTTYDVRIRFQPGIPINRSLNSAADISVEVLSPLRRRADAPHDRIPHVYREPSAAGPALLCLYDPRSDDWDRTVPFDRTLIPWAAEWLAQYELWQLTGTWTAPEAPHGLRPKKTILPDDKPKGGSSGIVVDTRPVMAGRQWSWLIGDTALGLRE